MTAKEYRDQYAKDQGFDDWLDLVKHTHWGAVDKHTDEVMKAYALSALPDYQSIENGMTNKSVLSQLPWTFKLGVDKCIEFFKMNIG